MPVPARVVEGSLATAVIAHLQVATEGSRTAIDEVADHPSALRSKRLERRSVSSKNLGQLWGAVLRDRHRLVRSRRLAQSIERTGRRPQVVSGDVRVALRRAEASMTEQGLDRPRAHARLHQMCREAVAERMKADFLVDARTTLGFNEGPLNHRLVHGLDRALAGEEPMARMALLPVLPQGVEKDARQHHIAVLPAFALLDSNHHLLAVDVAKPEVKHLAEAKPRAVADLHGRSIAQSRGRREKPPYFVPTERHRQSLRRALVCEIELPLPRHHRLIKEAHAADGLIDGRWRESLL